MGATSSGSGSGRSSCGLLTFAPGVDYSTSEHAESVAVADLNGDGKPDLAVGNSMVFGTNGTLSVLLNMGKGTFAPHVDYSTGVENDLNDHQTVAVGDLNGDGKPDLAATKGGGHTVAVLLNEGDGTFPAEVEYSTGTYPRSVVAVDLNGDGRLDLAVANYGDTNVSVLLNNGDGTFAPQVTYPLGSSPSAISAADVNGDGRPDLVAVNTDDNTVSVLLNQGDGTFSSKVDYPTGTMPVAVAALDLNGDGTPDIVVGNGDTTISVLLNKGDGTFSSQVDYPTPESGAPLLVVDMNGDGSPDVLLAEASPKGLAGLGVLLNNGDGTFAAEVDYPVATGCVALAAADLNGDGKPDLACLRAYADIVSVLLNTCE